MTHTMTEARSMLLPSLMLACFCGLSFYIGLRTGQKECQDAAPAASDVPGEYAFGVDQTGDAQVFRLSVNRRLLAKCLTDAEIAALPDRPDVGIMQTGYLASVLVDRRTGIALVSCDKSR